MSRIKLEDNMTQVMFKMSEGNPGALRVLMEIFQKDGGLLYILTLDDMEIYGSKIWVGYKDHCGMDINKYIESIRKRGLL